MLVVGYSFKIQGGITMKKIQLVAAGNKMKYSRSLIALVLGNLLGLVIFLPGCQNDSPVSFQDNPVTASGPQFIKLPGTHALAKIVADTAVITPEHGGRLELDFKYSYVDTDGVTRKLDASLSVTFQPHGVTDTLVATMSLDDQVLRSNIDLTFGPHGTTFLKPALLDVDVKGMDLSGLRPHDKVYLWYVDSTGEWIRMDAQFVHINIPQGRLVCNNGELPHFSAYAFGR
jgi:hypothetical protein